MSKDGGKLELGFVTGVIQQAIDGIHFAHELKDRGGQYLGIVHRDVTPSNIFLTDAGIVKILDFGIAKVKDASAHTQTGTVKGKYAYMAPEQLRGSAIDRRADVFALGIVLYEMLALRRLFQRKTDYLTFRAVMEQPIPDVRHYRNDCPAPLAAAVMRALDRDPDQRFATARQFGGAVLDAISGVGRPWTQGELGDFVGANFADAIHHRGAQIASAVRNGIAPAGIPVIAQPEEYLDIETADEFPPVDSVVSQRPDFDRGAAPDSESTVIDAPSGRVAMPEVQSERTDHSSRLTLQAELSQAGLSQPRLSQPRLSRSLIWPFVAFAMVAVAAGALFLVWQQIQNPHQIVIDHGPGSRIRQDGSNIVVEPSPPSAPAKPIDTAVAEISTPADTATEEPPRADPAPPRAALPRRPPPVPDPVVVKKKQSEVNRCVSMHGNVPAGTSLEIDVKPDGRPQRVAVYPVAVGATPLGGCIKAVFETAVFEGNGSERPITVTLRKK
jgi:serine/threonine-protein kinase